MEWQLWPQSLTSLFNASLPSVDIKFGMHIETEDFFANKEKLNKFPVN